MKLGKRLEKNPEHLFLFEHLNTLFDVERKWESRVLSKLQRMMRKDIHTIFTNYRVGKGVHHEPTGGYKNLKAATGGYWNSGDDDGACYVDEGCCVISGSGKDSPLLAITFDEERILKKTACAAIDMTDAYWRMAKKDKPRAEILRKRAVQELMDRRWPTEWSSKGAEKDDYFVGAWTVPGEIQLDYGKCTDSSEELERALRSVKAQYEEVLKIWNSN